jgi:hypothetical protein
MTVAVNDRHVTFVGNGIITVFPFDFPVTVQGTVRVFFGQLEQAPASYTLDKVARTVTFVTPPAIGVNITVAGATPLQQLITSSRAGSTVNFSAVEDQLDNMVNAQQELTKSFDLLQNYASFDDLYLGEKTSFPTTNNDGLPLRDGTLVSLTGQSPAPLDGMYVWRSGAWQSVLSPLAGTYAVYRYVATASQTVFSGVDANGSPLSYVPNAVFVTVNGATQTPNTYTATNGTSVVLSTALTAGDVVVIYSFGSFSVANTWTKAEANSLYARFNSINPPIVTALQSEVTAGSAIPDTATTISLAANAPIAASTFTRVPLITLVGADALGSFLSNDYLLEPLWGDRIRLEAFVTFAAFASGSVATVGLYRNNTFVKQVNTAILSGISTTVNISHTVPINQVGGTGNGAWEIRVWHNASATTDVTAADFTMEVTSRRLNATNNYWGRSIQGFVYDGQPRNWSTILSGQFGGDYQAMVNQLASFSVLNLGSVIGWGPGSRFPHPKTFAGSYQPTSPEFNLAGKTGIQFLKDIKAVNPRIKIFIYTTPLLDYTADPWDPLIGVPTAGSGWSPGSGAGRWANFANSLNACFEAGEDVVDGFYFDLCASTNIDRAKLDEATLIAKGYNKNVMVNCLFASAANAEFVLKCPYLSTGDYVYLEGFVIDSTLGDTTVGSTAVAALVAKHAGRGVRLFAVAEELGSTTIAGMTQGTPYTNWLNAYNLFFTYARPGWLIEHQRSSYDYVGSPGNG